MSIYIDVGKISEDLNNKADLDMNNTVGHLGTTAKEYFSAIGMPSTRYVSLALPASGGIVTAPANGYFVLRKVASANAQQLEVINNETRVGSYVFGNSGAWLLGWAPAKKGEEVYVAYTAGGELKYFGFVYAEGVK